MLEPVLLKSLRVLREAGVELTGREITEKVGEAASYIDKALGILVERDIITRVDGRFCYHKTPASEQFFEKLSSVYNKVTHKPEREMAVIGLLSLTTQRKYLLHVTTLLDVMEEGGFGPTDVRAYIDEEAGNGRIARFTVALGARRKIPFVTPPVMPFHYVAHFPPMDSDDYDRLKKDWLDNGFFITEEDYLMSNYPQDIVNPARECLTREMGHLLDRLKEVALAYPRLGRAGKSYPVLRWPNIIRGYSYFAFHYLVSPPVDKIHIQ